MKNLNHNLTQKMSQLENEKEHLQAVNVNHTKERDELQEYIGEWKWFISQFLLILHQYYK